MQIAAFSIALAAAGLMGFANQRGSTCTVAAIEEIVATRRFSQMVALLEASLWVGAGFVLLSAAHHLRTIPPDYAAGLATVAGGVLFGLGAYGNGACLFGTVARLGSGQLAYAATPLGLFLGSLAAGRLHVAEETHASSFVLEASALGVTTTLVLIVLRLCAHSAEIRRTRRPILAHLATPHVATTIIALAFLVVFATAGAWDYAELLRALGQRAFADWLPKSLLALALFAGAIAGGWTSGRLKLVAPAPARVVRCLAGGGLMGAGAALIPGGNTGLALLGMPLLQPYAWLAFATICVTIYLAIRLTRLRRWKSRRRGNGNGRPERPGRPGERCKDCK